MNAMTTPPRLRRLPGYGWIVESAQGDARALRRDDGTVLPIAGRLLGTREAARTLGVRPPNFVRDHASRTDFPEPVATLSSGRVWLADAIEQYASRRRRPRPGIEQMADIARRTVWWQAPDRTLARPLEFIARVMATGSLDDVHDVERQFGRVRLTEALTNAPPGVFDRRSWNYWRLVLGLDAAAPLPERHVP